MIAQGLKVGIVGGSIAGCTVAIELSRLGCDVILFERTGDELKDRGAGIGIPTAVFDTLVRRNLVDPDTPYFAGRGFTRLWRTPREARYGYLAWDQPADLALLNWGVLYRNLRKRVPDSIYRAEHRAVGLRTLAHDSVGIELADGTVPAFDLVVCTDGYTSLGRRLLFPEARIEYAGYVLWRGILKEAEMDETAPLQSGVHSPGYPGGHGIFYFVPGPDGSVAPGTRVVNWGMYVPVPQTSLEEFFIDKGGKPHEGSVPPGGMRHATEAELKRKAEERLPSYYREIVERSPNTFAYAIYDCHVPAYRSGRICLAGDAGAFARPHTAAGALKSINDAIALAEALKEHTSLDDALSVWDAARTETNNKLVTYGNQLGRALVKEIPDWSTMDAASMRQWFSSIVEIPVTMRDQVREEPR
jgi:2-polyprenyl-6-methoxyphenol hydroxylase-like FAD-dependent oxidoreductase